MRLNLGLGPASEQSAQASFAADPLKGARQAIRSQAAAREYVERQLAHAEATIQDLRTKLHHTRQEKDAAVEAARFATAAKATAQRALIATESALTTEKAARERADRALREAQALINHLQAGSATAVQNLETARAELEAERQARRKAETALREAKTAQDDAKPVNHEEAPAAPIRRKVGRPRKIPLLQVEPSTVPSPAAAVQATGKSSGDKASAARIKSSAPVPAENQEPVQWWVKGWDRRRR
jgi:hypothetical protein